MQQEDKVAVIFKMLASRFITYPQDLVFEMEDQGPRGAYVTVGCNRADRSRLIGKAGRNARAMTEILKTVHDGLGSRRPFRYNVLEPWRGVDEPETPFAYDEKWDTKKRDSIVTLAVGLLRTINPEISVSVREPVFGTTTLSIHHAQEFGPALKTSIEDIFDAIGRSCGRNLTLEFNANGDSSVQSSGLLAHKK